MQWHPIATPGQAVSGSATQSGLEVSTAGNHAASPVKQRPLRDSEALRWWRDLDRPIKVAGAVTVAAAVIVAGAFGGWALSSNKTAHLAAKAPSTQGVATGTTPSSSPSSADAPSSASPSPVSQPAVTVAEACNTADTDFTQVDNDSAGVIRGDNNEIATGHSFGPLIVELTRLSDNVPDSKLAALIATGTADVAGLRTFFIADSDVSTLNTQLDPDIQAVTAYCSAQSDPLGNS